MPSAPKHAHAVTVSLDRDMTLAEMTMLVDLIKRCKNTKYLTAIAERDEAGRVHFHAGVIMHQNLAITPGNFKHGTLLGSPDVRDMLAELSTDSYAVKVKSCYSDGWFAHYMDKGEQDYLYTDMPSNMADIEYAFTDIVTKKSANPQMEKYMRMYTDEARVIPATRVSVEGFFRYHWYREMDLKIVEERKRAQLYADLTNCLNGDDSLPDVPKKRGRHEFESHRYCPRCPDQDSAAILEPRQQYCDMCKKY